MEYIIQKICSVYSYLIDYSYPYVYIGMHKLISIFRNHSNDFRMRNFLRKHNWISKKYKTVQKSSNHSLTDHFPEQIIKLSPNEIAFSSFVETINYKIFDYFQFIEKIFIPQNIESIDVAELQRLNLCSISVDPNNHCFASIEAFSSQQIKAHFYFFHQNIEITLFNSIHSHLNWRFSIFSFIPVDWRQLILNTLQLMVFCSPKIVQIWFVILPEKTNWFIIFLLEYL